MIKLFCLINLLIVISGAYTKTVDILIHPMKLFAEKAEKECKRLGYNLIQIQNDEMNKFILDLAILLKLDRYWISGNDRKTEGNFVDSNGVKLNYTRFKSDNINNKSRNCLVGYFYKDEYWKDYKCNSRKRVICYKEKKSKDFTAIILTSKGTFILFNETKTFNEAQKLCAGSGVDLLQVNNALTNKFVNKLATLFKLGQYWVDVNGMEKEVTYESSENGKISFQTELELSTTNRTTHCVYETFGKSQKKTKSRKSSGSGKSNYGNRPRKSKYGKYKSQNTFWDDANCNDRHAVVCN